MSDDPILAWARSAGRPLGPHWADDAEALSSLDPLLPAADLAFLGEMDHFIHEKADFRLLCCRWLISRGWRAFAEELGWSDGGRVEAFLADGDPARLSRLSLFGWTGEQRADRDDKPAGIFRASFEVYPTALMASEQRRFYAGLRHGAGGATLRYWGFDIDGASGGAYADIAGALAPFAERPGPAAFLRRLQRIPGESVAQEASRLAALVATAAALAEDVGPKIARRLAADLQAMAESYAYVDLTYGAPTYEAVAPGMAYREGCMKRRWSDIRALGGAAPTALMAHALHLAKDDRLLGKVIGVGPGGGLECSIGHHLVREKGLKAVSIWLIFGSGEDAQPFPDLPRRFAYPRETLNARLAALGEPWLIPIAGGPFDRPVGVGHMYNAVQPATLAGQVDALLFLPEVSPLRPD